MLFVVALSVAAQEKEWQLVWSDEFNRDGRPDTAVWNYEHGFVRNQLPLITHIISHIIQLSQALLA